MLRNFLTGLLLTLAHFGVPAAQAQEAAINENSTTFKQRVQLLSVGQIPESPSWWYVVTHGMGGMSEGDRFDELAQAIKEAFPKSNVYLLNWTHDASISPWPWVVARRIDTVAELAISQLRQHSVDPAKVTLIGESLGNNVNALIAQRMGQVAHILALNPAHELGGGGSLNLRAYSQTAWSFHSQSPYDTHLPVADRSILLNTPHDCNAIGQHTYGVAWLRTTLKNGDREWLQLEQVIPEGPSGMFDVAISPDGELDWELAPRRHQSSFNTELALD